MYEALRINRVAFQDMVLYRLAESMPEEYSARIADHISDLVAQDVRETAGECWSYGDVGHGIGRVLMKTLGLEV